MCGAVTPFTYAFIMSRYLLHTDSVFSHLFTGVLIDVSEKVKHNDFEITAEDIVAWEKENCPLPRGSVVLIRFGWSSQHYYNRTAYFGFVSNSSSEMHFPGKTTQTSPPRSSFGQTKQY
jgi:kynurenine formamidase